MGTLGINYVRGDPILFASDSISVAIDGGPASEINDQQHLEFELSAGRHAVEVRGSRCKKTIELDMNGDISFTVTWDRRLGGLTVLGNAKETLMRNKAGRMFRLGIVEILALHIVNCALNYGKFYSGEAFLAVELACVVAIVVLISYLLRVRGRTIVIHSDWSKERIWNRTTGSPKTWLRFLRIQSKKRESDGLYSRMPNTLFG